MPPAAPARRSCSAQATVAAGKNYTVTANLTAPPVVGPALNVFVNNKAPVAKYASKATLNTGRVTVRHIAVAPAVDVFVNGNVAISRTDQPEPGPAKLGRGTYQVAAGLAGAGTAGIALGPIPLPGQGRPERHRVRLGRPGVRGRRRHPGGGAVRQADPAEAALVPIGSNRPRHPHGWRGRFAV